MRSWTMAAVATLLTAFGASGASAYKLFGPYDWGGDMVYPKWGDIHAGQPGGIVTWSIMPDGTTIDPSFTDPNISGTSSFNALIDSLGRDESLAAIQRVFDHWSAAANIYFVQVADSGAPFNSAEAYTSATGQLRIGAFDIVGNAGAVGYAAHPNGFTSLEGDVLFNATNRFQLAPGSEGDHFEVFPPPDFYFHNDFEGLLAHEVGHTLGLAHSDVPSLMYVDGGDFSHINRIPDPDDVAAVQFLYGPALRADFDHNSGVRGPDLALWKSGFGTESGALQTGGDANGDGRVDGADLLVWQGELGSGVALGAAVANAVPEPAAGMLAALAAAAFVRGRSGR